jgi:hypothetical protein
VRDQTERGLAYRNYVEQAASLPWVVGVQWFSYVDQSLTGRFFSKYSGEAMNIGLIDVVDRPYKELVDRMHETNRNIYNIVFGRAPAFAWDDPRFNPASGRRRLEGGTRKVVSVPSATRAIRVTGNSDDWPLMPGEPVTPANVVHGRPIPGFSADFRLCRDRDNLYLFVRVQDPTPMRNNQTEKDLWNGDAVELFIGARQPGQEEGPLLFEDRQIIISASEPVRIHVPGVARQSGIAAAVVENVTHDGYAMEIAIPWSLLDVSPQPGVELLFDIGIDDDGETNGRQRLRQIMWNGSERNHSDRGDWGQARLAF